MSAIIHMAGLFKVHISPTSAYQPLSMQWNSKSYKHSHPPKKALYSSISIIYPLHYLMLPSAMLNAPTAAKQIPIILLEKRMGHQVTAFLWLTSPCIPANLAWWRLEPLELTYILHKCTCRDSCREFCVCCFCPFLHLVFLSSFINEDQLSVSTCLLGCLWTAFWSRPGLLWQLLLRNERYLSLLL